MILHWVLWVPCKTVWLLFFWKVVLFFWLAFWLAVKYWLFWGDGDSENSKSFLLCEKCFVFFVAIITTCCPSGSSNLQSISERSLFPQAARFSSHSTSDTPWKINMEPNHRSLIQMIFLLNWVIFRWTSSVQGAYDATSWWQLKYFCSSFT